MRRCGVLMPVFSLASEYGIGCFSKEAYRFVEFCERTGLKLWQVLPMGPTSFGDSPYQSFSAFALNPYFLDLEDLVSKGLLTRDECEEALRTEGSLTIHYDQQYQKRFPVLHKAFKRFMENSYSDYETFKEEQSDWLYDYALYMALKDAHGGKCFMDWEPALAKHEKKAVEKAKETYREEMEFQCFLQYFCFMEWNTLHQYANEHGVRILGDIPIYVAFDSADVWSNRKLFLLQKDGYPTKVAGCPPDAFSDKGQLWGNPLYDWKAQKKDGFSWWMKRMRHNFNLFDELRIDHFRGFDAYFAIPYGREDAVIGEWEDGPGEDFFTAVRKAMGNPSIVAEDLGTLTDSVRSLLKSTGYPGMKVLQFAFSAGEKSDYLPHRYEKNCVVYTGTHDNDTVRGWYETMPEADRKFLEEYLGKKTDQEEVTWELIRLAMASVADTCIIPIQDFCNLGTDARINTPSTIGINWMWRMNKEQITPELEGKIRDMIGVYER